MTTPLEASKRGGKRPGAGAKADIPTKIIALGIAIRLGVGLSQARKLIREWTPEGAVGGKYAQQLRGYGTSKEAKLNLDALWVIYSEQRERAGYKP